MIRKLPSQIINRIAAGQIVQRPYNALKQLIQNSIDSGATSIYIRIQNGGLNKLQIRDNGKGIMLQDYPLLCARFATSKIKTMEDLQSIESFGFRGEALASLTYVGKVEVSSRYMNCQYGYYAKYQKEKLILQPKQIKRQIGTTIIVEDLFQNLSLRRKSLTPNQQKKLIKQLIFQMALNYPHIQFNFYTQKDQQLFIDYSSQSQDDAIMKIFCQLTGILKNNCLFARTQLHNCHILGIFSKLNTWNKPRNILISINNRIVQCPQIQKLTQKAYDQSNRTIHKQKYSYCCYINLKINPKRIDCNVHPTKKMIQFYKANHIFYDIMKWIEELLQNSGTVKFVDPTGTWKNRYDEEIYKKFKEKIVFGYKEVKNLEVNSTLSQLNHSINNNNNNNNTYNNTFYQSQKVQYAFNKTRTDSSQLPLSYFYKLNSSQSHKKNPQHSQTSHKFIYKYPKQQQQQQQQQQQFQYNQKKQDQILKTFIQSITYVGCFSPTYIFIQLDNKLLCFNIYPLSSIYINHYLKQLKSLYIKQLKPQQKQKYISIPQILQRFLNKNKHVIKSQQKIYKIYTKTLEQIKYNKDIVQEKYGIKINQSLQIQQYPIINQVFQNQSINQDQLAYFFIQIYATTELNYKQKNHQSFVDLLASVFRSNNNQQNNIKMSQFTDKYDRFFNDQFIPTLKLKGKYYQNDCKHIKISNILSEMMDLKDAYKMFQRC